jgi:uncharacterized protein (DUF433 family)
MLDRHPIIHRAGASGARRAAVIGTRLSVWQVVETVRGEGGDVAAAARYLGIAEALVRAATDYYADFPAEVDAQHIDDITLAATERARGS